jgi:hypothetical protein
MSDLIQVIEEEFEVTKDPIIQRQINESRIDRNLGRTYTGKVGLDFLQQKIQEFSDEKTL